MPRLQRNELQIKGDYLVGVMQKYMRANDVNVSKLAKSIAMSESTLYKKLREPRTFVWPELYMIFKVLKVPSEEIVECFPGELKPVKVNVILSNEMTGKEVEHGRY